MDKKEHLNEEKYQRANIILRIVGFALIFIGIIGIIFFFGEFGSFAGNFGNSVDDVKMPNIALIFLSFLVGFGGLFGGIACVVVSFRRKIIAYTTQQTMPIATEAINKGVTKIKPAIDTMTDSIGRAVNSSKDVEAELQKIEDLKRKGLITAEEYTKMRGKILGL